MREREVVLAAPVRHPRDDRVARLDAHGLVITEQLPIEAEPTPENEAYLRTKRERMGHTITHQGRQLDTSVPAPFTEGPFGP